MLGNFTYCNPTKLYFGGGSVASLRNELPKYGPNIVLVYGGGSIKTNGIYDQVTAILKDCGKNVAEISGVMPSAQGPGGRGDLPPAPGRLSAGRGRRVRLRLHQGRGRLRPLRGGPLAEIFRPL